MCCRGRKSVEENIMSDECSSEKERREIIEMKKVGEMGEKCRDLLVFILLGWGSRWRVKQKRVKYE